MQTRTIRGSDLRGFLNGLLADYRMMAPVEAEPGFYRFDWVHDVGDVVLDYVSTILPPKKALFPQREVLFTYASVDGKPVFTPVFDDTPQVLVGVHPCDLAGIEMLDQALQRDPADVHYAARRKATRIIGVDCRPDEHCFCAAVDTCRPDPSSFDLFLTPIHDGYLVEIGTDQGAELLDRHARAPNAGDADRAAAESWRQRKASQVGHRFGTELANLPLTFQRGITSDVWERVAEPCLSCGTCNLVCPTCYCFDAEDITDPDGAGGVRQRRWDGCHLSEFARVSGGHSFRPKPADRLRHRFYRKYQYLMTLHGRPFCTGCGRCGRSCPVDINIVDTVNSLVADTRAEGPRHVAS